MVKKFFIWLLAILITLTAVVYQRMTGPTNPKRVKFELAGKEYSTKLTRSLETQVTLEEAKGDYNLLGKTEELRVIIPDIPASATAKLSFARYPSNDSLSTIEGIKEGEHFIFTLPAQPPAGKIKYFIEIEDNGVKAMVDDEKTLIRFKNSVPAGILIPHILLMFLAMLFANYTGILSFTKSDKVRKNSVITIVLLGIGGLILGPIVQKFAFGAFWTGWPLGEDLTDNKTLFAFLFWAAAIYFNRRNSRRYLYAIAALVMLLVYSIPHSTAGSEYDHSKGEIVSGR